jgi:hypothetical protein
MDQTVSAVKAMSPHSGDTDKLRASKWENLPFQMKMLS